MSSFPHQIGLKPIGSHLQKFRETLVLLLIFLLPFHAFLVTVLTKLLAGPGNAPLSSIAVWKELVVVGVLGLAVLEIVAGCWLRVSGSRNEKQANKKHYDILDVLIIGFIFLAGVHSFFALQSDVITLKQMVYGVKYDVFPLVLFLVLRRVVWFDVFKERLLRVLLVAGFLVACSGIISFFLPMEIFRNFGYSELHSLYQASGPLAPFQQIEALGVRRVQGVMGGPNQLGIWLCIVWGCFLAVHKGFQRCRGFRRISLGTFGTVGTLCLILTFSRSAWIAAFVITVVALYSILPRKQFTKWASIGSMFCILVGIIAVSIAPGIVLRAASSKGHIEKPLEAIGIIKEHPLGLGLGTAGPASNRVSDTCVHLPIGADASWAEVHQNLCVYVGENQVQPVDGTCSCPVLPENWYLQIGVELGVVGFVLFIVLTVLILKALWISKSYKLTATSFFSFLAVSIASLFLHAWEDSAVAITVWVLVAVSLSVQKSFPESQD